jgi:hypothetical protein
MDRFNNKIKQIQESLEFDMPREEVREDGKKIADFDWDVAENLTISEVIDLFYFDDPKNDPVAKYLRSLKLPKKFTYIWIQLLRILSTQRGLGRGSEIINTLAMQHPPGTLMALSPGEISSGQNKSSHKNLMSFYKQNGFKIVKSNDGVEFAFRITS